MCLHFAVKDVLALAHLIQATLDSLDREMAKRNVKWTLTLEPSSPLVHADEALMRHVFISLIANALDAMP